MTTYSLSRAVPGDARALAEVAARAFAHDAHTQVKAAARPPGDFADGMAEGFGAWLAVPARCAVLKAVDDGDGRVVGAVCWAFRGVDVEGSAPPAGPPTMTEAAAAEKTVVAGPTAGVPPTTEAAEETAVDPAPSPSPREEHDAPSPAAAARIAALETLTDAHLAAFQAAVMPAGARRLYVVALAVDPAAQGRGVGARLLRWGTERADAAGVPCWVHASPAGAAVFARHGFVEVDRLVVNLDRWAVAPPPSPPGAPAARWGEYVFRGMVRQPRADGDGRGGERERGGGEAEGL